jgi:hypothetical protein
MVAAGARFAFATRTDHIARAILVRAEVRSPTMHVFLFRRLSGVEGGVRSPGVAGHPAPRRAARKRRPDTNR